MLSPWALIHGLRKVADLGGLGLGALFLPHPPATAGDLYVLSSSAAGQQVVGSRADGWLHGWRNGGRARSTADRLLLVTSERRLCLVHLSPRGIVDFFCCPPVLQPLSHAMWWC